MARITIVQGHPDSRGDHFGNALDQAYAEGARIAGHEVRRADIARMEFPQLRSADAFYDGRSSPDIAVAQEAILWADHLVIFYPLWQGNLPSLLHAFIEQTFRPGFGVETGPGGGFPRKPLRGKTVRIVVTMGMPGWFYRWRHGAYALKTLERNVLRFAGVRSIRSSLIGLLGAGVASGPAARAFPALASAGRRARWLDRMRSLGRQAR